MRYIDLLGLAYSPCGEHGVCSGSNRDPFDIFNDSIRDSLDEFPIDHAKGDAYKHCLGACRVTRANGEPVARAFGYANEKFGDWGGQRQGDTDFHRLLLRRYRPRPPGRHAEDDDKIQSGNQCFL